MNAKSYCRIRTTSIVVNGKRMREWEPEPGHNAPINQTLDHLFAQLAFPYANFSRMDNFNKLGFLAAEIVMRDAGTSPLENMSDTVIFLETRSSTMDSDWIFQKSIDNKENYHPDSDLFAYMAPNVVCGEIAIRHRIFGETSMCSTESFCPGILFDALRNAFLYDDTVKHGLVGYLECFQGFMSALFLYIDRESIDLSPENYEMAKESFVNDLFTIY